MQRVKEYFSFLYKAYGCIFLTCCLFLIFALVTAESNLFSDEDIPYIVADIIVMIVGIAFAYYYMQKRIKEAKKRRGLREKLFQYRKAMFIPWIVMANVTAFSIACYIISGEHLFICSAIFTLVILILRRPSPKRFIEEMDLAVDEERIIENPNSAI